MKKRGMAVFFCVLLGVAALGAGILLYHKIYVTEDFITTHISEEKWTTLCTLNAREKPYFIGIVSDAMNDAACEIRFVQKDTQAVYDTMQIPAGTEVISSLTVEGDIVIEVRSLEEVQNHFTFHIETYPDTAYTRFLQGYF